MFSFVKFYVPYRTATTRVSKYRFVSLNSNKHSNSLSRASMNQAI